jgi:hypothetical protein
MSSIEIAAQIVVCNSFDSISNFIGEKISSGYQVHCVETEYGSKVAFGNGINLNHHGVFQFNKAPCIFPNMDESYNYEPNIICLSHVDLDSVGGVAAILGMKPESKEMEDFWFLAELVDNQGPHRFPREKYPNEFIAMNIWWAWSKKNRGPRVTSEIQDISEYIVQCIEILHHIEKFLKNQNVDENLLAVAHSLIESEDKLNEESLMKFGFIDIPTAWKTKVFPYCVRKASEFTNHLYKTLGYFSNTAQCVIALNEKFGSITISFEHNLDDFLCMDCRKIVQAYPYWGCDSNLAGGKDVIAGSPRDHKYDEKDLATFVEWFEANFQHWLV